MCVPCVYASVYMGVLCVYECICVYHACVYTRLYVCTVYVSVYVCTVYVTVYVDVLQRYFNFNSSFILLHIYAYSGTSIMAQVS